MDLGADTLRAIKDRVASDIERLCEDPVLRSQLVSVLERAGFPLSPGGACRAGALSVAAYESVRGSTKGAIEIAASVELLMAACYVIDDLADEGVSTEASDYGAGVLNAVSLLTLANAAATEAHLGGSAAPALLAFHTRFLNACAGENLDLHDSGLEDLSLDEAMDVTVRKSGSLGQIAASAGAACAGADGATVALIGDFGLHLFTYFQLLDDIRDIEEDSKAGTEEYPFAFKKTLPLLYLHHGLREADPAAATAVATTTQLTRQDIRGAELFGSVVAETYLDAAKECLRELACRNIAVESLRECLVAAESMNTNTNATA